MEGIQQVEKSGVAVMPDEKLARAIRAKVRRDILREIMRNGRMSVNEVARRLGISEYSASRHLKLLYDLGILDYELKPPEKYYYSRLKGLRDLLDAFDRVVDELKEV